jgi:hypothetical protein
MDQWHRWLLVTEELNSHSDSKWDAEDDSEEDTDSRRYKPKHITELCRILRLQVLVQISCNRHNNHQSLYYPERTVEIWLLRVFNVELLVEGHQTGY